MDAKELDKFLKICRKQGVLEIDFDGLKVKFSDIPMQRDIAEQTEEIDTDSLSPEQLMFYHTNGGTA